MPVGSAHAMPVSFATAAVLVLVLMVAFPPFWETNDDVAMSMMAHGYGLAAYASPYLLFSNIAWGQLLTFLPPIGGVLAYSWVSLATVFATAWAVLYFMERLRIARWLGIAVVALVFTKAVAFPQFTVTAGLLTVGAVLGWRTYSQVPDVRILILSTALALVGFLVRYDECVLTLVVALPLLLERRLLADRGFLLSVATLFLAAAAFSLLHAQAYDAPEWRRHGELSFLVKAFADYGALSHFAAHPELAQRHGFSLNDLALFTRFFYVDPAIADPERLGALLGELDPVKVAQSNLPTGIRAIRALAQPSIVALTAAAIVLGVVLKPGRRLIAAWILFLAAIFTIGLLGRAGQIRVYYPLVALLLLTPVFLGEPKRVRLAIAGVAIAAALPWALSSVAGANREWTTRHEVVSADLSKLSPGELYVDWGGQFPYEAAHPVLLRDDWIRRIRLYTLASSSVAPFSLAQWSDREPPGLLEQLFAGPALALIADESRLALLREYCREHHGRQLAIERVQRLETFSVSYVTCR